MKDTSIKIKDVNNSWYSDELSAPVSVRVMNDQIVNFHKHEGVSEMFVVLSGTLFIDIKESNFPDFNDTSFDDVIKTVKVSSSESYTIPSGTEHRTRVVGRAELMVIGGDKDMDLDSFGVTRH